MLAVALLGAGGVAAQESAPSPAPTVRVMVFPVAGAVRYTDTHGAPRGGGLRRHEGQDLMGPKMTPVVAAADGVVSQITIPEGPYGHSLTITGRDGWSYRYIHLNNDNLGTDDGRAPLDLVFGPGIRKGTKVHAGQLVGFFGDSGNAEDTPPHLHFELRDPSGRPANAFLSLQAASRFARPLGLPAGHVMPPLGTSKATPRPSAPRPTTTTTAKAAATTSSTSSSTTSTTTR